MSSPIQSPVGNWWHIGVSRHEKLWVSISVVWALLLSAQGSPSTS